ncbi:SMP-30/gluconolactonase/LRE family protein [Dyadobacter koreensis]|nr:SMP-30/gluconolactonase/LRE family protein [Dyadobacter koreensis]
MKKYIFKSLLLFSSIIAIPAFAQKNYPTLGKVTYNDPKLEKLLPKNSKLEVLAMGFDWCEGPVWVKNGGYLLFSDVPKNTVYKWDEKNELSVFLKPSGFTGLGEYSNEPGSNGLIIDKKGRLISCEHGDRRISAMPLSNAGKITLSDNFEGKRFNSPNDIVEHPTNGSYYFTDPPYGLAKHENDPTREIPYFGVYQITPKGETKLVIRDLSRPNGLSFSPDGKTLYVSQSDPEKAILMAYPLQADGSVGKGKMLYDATPMSKTGLTGLPDGFKLDIEGNIWTSGPGGILIISPDGKLLGKIETLEIASNCAWGNDGSMLYMTVDGYLCRIKTSTKGANW